MTASGLIGLPKGQPPNAAAATTGTLRNLRTYTSTNVTGPVNHCYVPTTNVLVTVGAPSNTVEFRSLTTGNVIASSTGVGFQWACYVPTSDRVMVGTGSAVYTYSSTGTNINGVGVGQFGVYSLTYIPPLDEVWATHTGYSNPNFSRLTSGGTYTGTFTYTSWSSSRGVCYVASNQMAVVGFYNSNVLMSLGFSGGTPVYAGSVSGGGLSNPEGICWAPSSNLIYVANSGNATINVYTTSLVLVTTMWAASTPTYMVYHAPTDRIYVTCQGGSLLIIDPNTNTIVGTLSAQQMSVSYNITGIASIPQTNQIAVSGLAASNTSIFDAPREGRFRY